MKVTAKKSVEILLIILWTASPAWCEETHEDSPAPPPNTESESTEKIPDLSEIIPLAAKLSGQLATLETKVQSRLDLESMQKKQDSIETNLNRHADTIKQMTASGDFKTAKFLMISQEIKEEKERLIDISRPLKKEIQQLEIVRNEWLKEKKNWNLWQSAWEEKELPEQLKPIFAKAHNTIESGLNIIGPQLEILLTRQENIGTLRETVYALDAELDKLAVDKRYRASLDASPPMFSPRYVTQFRGDLWHAFLGGLHEIAWPGSQYLAQLAWILLVQALVFLALSIALYRKRKVLEQSTRWRFFAVRPFSAVIFLICTISGLFYELEGVPPIWKLVNMIIGGIAFARLAGMLTDVSWKKQFVYGLMILWITTRCLNILEFPLPLFRLYIVIAALVGLLFCWKWARQSTHQKDRPVYAMLLRLSFVFYAVVIIAQLFGQEALSFYLFISVIKSMAIVLVFVLLMRMIHGGLEWVFRTSPLRHASALYGDNIDAVISRMLRFVGIAGSLILLPGILLSWGTYKSLDEAIIGFWNFGFNLGSLHLTVGLIITAIGVLYGTFFISWIFRKLFLDVLLRQRRLELGVRLSIERLIHYVVVFIGFVLAISMLGFELTKLTIILSALGVGIGFGLQSIVNNFVSGLILLFEQPIREGDTVEIGGNWAEVKRIGLRATTVQTFSQSDVIIPNADLTTNQVTNWTLSNRQVRLIIPVGVVYGSDVPRVMETLMACARENSMVAKNPEPMVLFLNFGESSLDFELRVWIDDANNRLITKSALHQEIDRRFREANIVIAFPQRDLHLRTLDESIRLPAPDTPP